MRLGVQNRTAGVSRSVGACYVSSSSGDCEVPPLRSITTVGVALLVVAAAHAADVPSAAEHLSIGGSAGASSRPPAFTLLDREWLLPPIESLEAAALLAKSADRADQMLRDDIATALPPPVPSAEPLAYSLSDDVTARLRYDHAQISDRANSQTLREDESTAFSTRPDRNVVGLNMSWRLAGSTVGLGYQLESSRLGNTGDFGIGRFLPGNQQALHSFTLGLTRSWGAAAPPPVLVEPPLVSSPVELAAEGASPTPIPLGP